MAELLPIGEIAGRCGVKVPTIRYYEEIGLLPLPTRTAGNRRLYGPSHLARLGFIRHARELGFEVDAIRTLLSLQDKPDQPCDTADAIVRARLHEVRDRITKLQSLKRELQRMVEQCNSTGTIADCNVIETLSNLTHNHGRLE